MTEHRIYARHDRSAQGVKLDIPLIKRCVRAALDIEGVDISCEVSVLITNNHVIREINSQFRGIDSETDVLSFPMQELTAGEFSAGDCEISPETMLAPLGDIVVSAEKVVGQAWEYGHSVARETGYLVIHSVLHLLGYDHVDEGAEKRKMREREMIILERAGLGEAKDADKL